MLDNTCIAATFRLVLISSLHRDALPVLKLFKSSRKIQKHYTGENVLLLLT